MKINICGRPHSKKNSRQVFWRGGKMVIAPSAAYEKWKGLAVPMIIEQWNKKPISADHAVKITCRFYILGKYHVDIDNLLTSVCDMLQDAKVIEDDDQIIETHAFKHPGSNIWSTTVEVEIIDHSAANK